MACACGPSTSVTKPHDPDDLGACLDACCRAESAVAREIQRLDPSRLAEQDDDDGTTAAVTIAAFRSARYGRIKRRFRTRVNGLTRAVLAGTLSVAVATERFREFYREAAMETAEIGVTKAGSRFNLANFAWVDGEVDKQTMAFGRFLRNAKRDDGDIVFTGGVVGLLVLYINRLDGVRNAAWAQGGSGEGVLWWWRLGDAEHCVDCISLHMNSPYRVTAPAVPRGGSTRCSANCRCSLIRTTGGRAP